MKKIVLLFITLTVTTFSLYSCGGGSSSGQDDNGTQTGNGIESYRVGSVVDIWDHNLIIYPQEEGRGTAETPYPFSADEERDRAVFMHFWAHPGIIESISVSECFLIPNYEDYGEEWQPTGTEIMKDITFTVEGVGSYVCPSLEYNEGASFQKDDFKEFVTNALNKLITKEKVICTVTGFTNKEPDKLMEGVYFPRLAIEIRVKDLTLNFKKDANVTYEDGKYYVDGQQIKR